MKRLRRHAIRALAFCALSGAAYIALIFCPGALLPHARAGAPIVLHSAAPLPSEIDPILALAVANVQRSPIFDPARSYHVYLCSRGWQWSLLTGLNSRSAAISGFPGWLTRTVIVRGANVEHDRYLQASGREAPGERTFHYELAHEVTHVMSRDFLSARGASSWPPPWVAEGYADYVGRGAGFDYDDARAALLGWPRTGAQSGQYLRYTLLVAHLLEREGWSVERLLRSPPDPVALEARVRAGLAAVPRFGPGG